MSYSANCLTLVFNEDVQAFVSEASYRAQLLLPLPGRGVFSLPLPGQAATPAGGCSLWQHRALPASGPGAAATSYYGFAHGAYAEFIVLGTSAEVQKELQNVLLVCDGPDPVSLTVSTPSQGSFTQALVGGVGTSIVRRNLQRKSDTTYLTVQAPAALPWGGRARGKWLRLRLTLAQGNGQQVLTGQQQLRLLKAQTTMRDVFD